MNSRRDRWRKTRSDLDQMWAELERAAQDLSPHLQEQVSFALVDRGSATAVLAQLKSTFPPKDFATIDRLLSIVMWVGFHEVWNRLVGQQIDSERDRGGAM